MVIEAGLHGLGHVLRLRVTGQGHEWNATELRVGAHRPRHVVPVHAGQADVAEHDIGHEGTSLLEPLGAAVSNLDDMLGKLECLAQAIRRVDVVLDD